MARPRRARTTDSRHDFPIAPNLLERNFIAAAPNRIWLADITYGAPRPEESGERMFGMQCERRKCEEPASCCEEA
jgi:transposase InsO family protein